jgi:hypothetical protein
VAVLPIDYNNSWRGFTVVRRLALEADPEDYWRSNLILDLSKGDVPTESILRVTFCVVSQLRLHSFGGGLTQVLHLQATDISERQLDQVRYEVRELERDAIAFCCRSIEISGGIA